ncbi:5419_t:CDS:2, partial [Scutellospora calospora]
MSNETSNSTIFDNINECDVPSNNLDNNTKVEWYIQVDPSLVKECKKFLHDLKQNSIYSKKISIKYIPNEVYYKMLRQTINSKVDYIRHKPKRLLYATQKRSRKYLQEEINFDDTQDLEIDTQDQTNNIQDQVHDQEIDDIQNQNFINEIQETDNNSETNNDNDNNINEIYESVNTEANNILNKVQESNNSLEYNKKNQRSKR